ncbi:MAG: alcohol dehydrogenase [Verrucomicrobia bacterium]|nr:MAG: alcohol dehydrogenase [Verrucomicrobiota bacterium]
MATLYSARRKSKGYTMQIPSTQQAVQLVGPDQLQLNKAKAVHQPGPHQILCRVDVCGLCFSDLKLLKQFSAHVRKTPILSGIAESALKEIASYVPNEAPTVPGHEAVVTVVAAGPGVTHCKVGGRYLVQTDYRWLRTANSNGAFGYNLEGALQEYVLLDERVYVAPDGQSMMIPITSDKSSSALALCEPWACVEDAYVVTERQTLKTGGRLLIVADAKPDACIVDKLLKATAPQQFACVSSFPPPPAALTMQPEKFSDLAAVPENTFDDILYFGANADTVEKLFAKLTGHGLLVICQCGMKFGRPVTTAVGRVHYGGIRIVGTPGSEPSDALRSIPPTGEIRKGDKINVIGAGGPMGVMHVVRNLCQGVPGVSIYAGDLSDERLAALTAIADPIAQKNNLGYHPYNAKTSAPAGVTFNYAAVMAPVPALVAAALAQAATRGIINIFAGIPATVSGPIDLDLYCAKGCYFVGTSGSTLDDMLALKRKVENGQLDTNVSVAAISGLEGAIEGIRAVEKQQIPGKILVYPACKGLGLTPLPSLGKTQPQVFQALENGLWTKRAEQALLAAADKK